MPQENNEWHDPAVAWEYLRTHGWMQDRGVLSPPTKHIDAKQWSAANYLRFQWGWGPIIAPI